MFREPFVVFDLDGTVVGTAGRLHFVMVKPKDYDGFHKASVYAEPIAHIRPVWWGFWRQRIPIEIWTGRPQKYEVITRNWLSCHGFTGCRRLRMRAAGDTRPDTEIKKSWLDECGVYKPMLVFEDRSRVVDMYREAGVPCFQVVKGDY